MTKKTKIFFAVSLLLGCVAIVGGNYFLSFNRKQKKEKEILLQKEKDAELKIGVITDIHACVEGYPDLNPFLLATKEARTDFNVSLGDNINFRVGNCSASYQADLSWVTEKLKLAEPFHWVLGDHDIGDENSVVFWKEKTGKNKEYYSFDKGDFHIVILDTILGGDEMRLNCSLDEKCLLAENNYKEIKKISKNPIEKKVFIEKNKLDEVGLEQLLKERLEAYEKELDAVKWVRSSGRRDIGRIGQAQLDWLLADLAGSQKSNVVVFSDHPLFHFISHRKEYNIENGESVRKILESSGKEVVAISGEAHLWHEENLNGIHYFIIDRFSGNGSFAVFNWNKDGFRLEKFPR